MYLRIRVEVIRGKYMYKNFIDACTCIVLERQKQLDFNLKTNEGYNNNCLLKLIHRHLIKNICQLIISLIISNDCRIRRF